MTCLASRPHVLLVLTFLCLLLSASTFADDTEPTSQGPGYPLLDGLCTEYPRLAAKSFKVSDTVTLYIFQDNSYVWMCYTLPTGSFGTVDVRLQTPALSAAINLHVSAQLGEWPADKPDEAPQTSDSSKWWQIVGWTANAMRLNGMVDGENERRPNFLPAEGREFQLAKSRFGRGDWHLRFQIRAVAGAGDDGKPGSLWFPSKDSLLELEVD